MNLIFEATLPTVTLGYKYPSIQIFRAKKATGLDLFQPFWLFERFGAIFGQNKGSQVPKIFGDPSSYHPQVKIPLCTNFQSFFTPVTMIFTSNFTNYLKK